MKTLLKMFKKLFRRKPKGFEIRFPTCVELSDEERAWLFGEELNDK